MFLKYLFNEKKEFDWNDGLYIEFLINDNKAL